MNILCPNCQKTLTVPEECAGQMMQCPLCHGTFTMPALAGGPAAPPMPSGAPETFSLPSAASEVYKVAADPKGPAPIVPPPLPPRKPTPLPGDGVQDLVLPSIAGEYRHALPIKLSVPFLRWLVPVCLILIFLLSFFEWVGAYPGGIGILTQTGWGTAFGGWSHHKEVENLPDLKAVVDYKKDSPGSSGLMIVYIILIIVLFLASVAVIVFNLIPKAVPPAVANFMTWQGLILGAVALLAFLFLGIEMLKGFNLKNTVVNKVNTVVNRPEGMSKSGFEIMKGTTVDGFNLRHTFWFRLVVLLNVLAILGGAMQFWMARRGHKPPPKLELDW